MKLWARVFIRWPTTYWHSAFDRRTGVALQHGSDYSWQQVEALLFHTRTGPLSTRPNCGSMVSAYSYYGDFRTAVIFGRAKGVWDELRAAQQLCDFDLTIAIGSAGVDYPGHIDAWVSFHAELFEFWCVRRARLGYSEVKSFWSNVQPGRRTGVRDKVPANRVECDGGSSGLIGVMVALQLGCKGIVLAGIPMERGRGQYDTEASWTDAEQYHEAWIENLAKMRGKVKSMSGWTASLLGSPTKEWLDEAVSESAA